MPLESNSRGDWHVIAFKLIRKEFPSKVALDDVTFTIAKPQMVGIIGRSGAGKSTLLRMINRLIDPSDCRAISSSTAATSPALRGAALRRWQRDCAMIFQQFNLVPRLDVLTNVLLGRLNAPLDHAAACSSIFSRAERATAIMALDRLDIAADRAAARRTLSGGQQQRVAIARAHRCRSRRSSSPTSRSPRSIRCNAKIVMDSLRAINEHEGITVITNLHTLDTARAYCEPHHRHGAPAGSCSTAPPDD